MKRVRNAISFLSSIPRRHRCVVWRKRACPFYKVLCILSAGRNGYNPRRRIKEVHTIMWANWQCRPEQFDGGAWSGACYAYRSRPFPAAQPAAGDLDILIPDVPPSNISTWLPVVKVKMNAGHCVPPPPIFSLCSSPTWIQMLSVN